MKLHDSKIINSRCVCGLGLSWSKDKTIMLEPCEHIFHKKCINFTNCPICNTKIKKYYTEEDLKLVRKDSKYYQKYIDIVCVKNIDDKCKKDVGKFVINLPIIMDLIGRLPFSRGFDQGHDLCKDTLTLANVKLTIIGKKNIKNNNKIIIANHSSIMDFMIMFYVFKCGFLASNLIKETWIGKMVAKIIPILFIDRGKETNTVDKMKEYIETQGSLCVFPEGIIVHPETLGLFRTGSFYTDQPILPVIINYQPLVSDSTIGEFLQKLASQEKIEITVKILPMEYPPFDNNKINTIRYKMAKAGNLALSRISNRDAIDKKKR